jgi:hypothetical protein
MRDFIGKFLILPLFLLLFPLFGQEYSTGAILDPVRYAQTDTKPVLVTRNYSSLPRSVSLKQYSPIPESQGQYGTCTGWATAFAARTISESIALNRTHRLTSNVFSPYFVYVGHFLRRGITPTGHEGAVITDVLNYMRREGAVKRLAFEDGIFLNLIDNFEMFTEGFSRFADSRRYPIAGYVRLFLSDYPETMKVSAVKKSLAEGKPVIIGMNVPLSFRNRSVTGVWQPYGNEDPNGRYPGHAMCVVGYDDDMYGGAFEVQNSWGTNWGNDGYIWIRYGDFAAFVDEAYEIIENLSLYREATRFSASIEIEVFNDNRGMPVFLDSDEDIQFDMYRTRFSYPQGTVFQFQMTNRYPAYVYAFSADNSSSDIEHIFPMPGVSPVLDYADSTVAWPGENEGMMLATTAGIHYLVVLYSKEALDIEAIERRFAEERGSFTYRVSRAVGSNFIPPYGPNRNLQYNSDAIEFTAETYDPKSVFGLFLAIGHYAR